MVEEQRIMREEQNGFRRDRHGKDNLFVVKFGGDRSKVMAINGDETERDRVEYWRSYLVCILSKDRCTRA
ncbi:hypothetical protein FHG87_013043 [Trinorchestia longiramus]|nr:hypothetical protein FHG87_013043 [Trinorchestia longiramus]